MPNIYCRECMFWVRRKDDGKGKDDPVGDCMRYPQKAAKPADSWCGEGVSACVSAQPGRNRG